LFGTDFAEPAFFSALCRLCRQPPETVVAFAGLKDADHFPLARFRRADHDENGA